MEERISIHPNKQQNNPFLYFHLAELPRLRSSARSSCSSFQNVASDTKTDDAHFPRLRVMAAKDTYKSHNFSNDCVFFSGSPTDEAKCYTLRGTTEISLPTFSTGATTEGLYRTTPLPLKNRHNSHNSLLTVSIIRVFSRHLYSLHHTGTLSISSSTVVWSAKAKVDIV